MQLVVVDGLDVASVERGVSASTFAKGSVYARQRAVLHSAWDEEESALRAVVRGGGTARYHTSAYFRLHRNGSLRFESGECSCPVGYDCKHVVAAALTSSAPRSVTAPPAAAPEMHWERALGSLLEPTDRSPGRANLHPIAVELTLTLPPPLPAAGRMTRHPQQPTAPRVLARLVRPGRHGGWVAGGLTWGKLDSPYSMTDCVVAHVRLLRELYALHRSGSRVPSYYSTGEVRTIDLAGLASRRLWSFLDEAAEIGVQFVHARKKLGAIEPYDHAELCLDVTSAQAPGSVAITPVLRRAGTELPDSDIVPVAFLGADGHGLVHVSRAQVAQTSDPADWTLRLARLATPASEPLQRLLLQGERVPMPADQQERFRDEFYPRLRHLATIISTDDTFTPPSISVPTLVLRAAYAADHALELVWEWAYQVGDTQLRTPLGTPATAEGFRDPAMERLVLDELGTSLEELGMRDVAPVPEMPARRLGGLDTMRFTTEVLPQLTGAPGVVVEIGGEPTRYREAGDSVQIGVSATADGSGTDWFDLGVRITVEGRDVAFGEVFVALAAGESHLLLPDGAYFSLMKPQLQALRSLIEEARELQDTPAGPLRISRFQADLWHELASLGVIDHQAAAWQRQVDGLLSLDGLTATPVPATLSAELRPYQREGFEWLCFLWRHGLGGVLADDMGLGKTVQTLALLCHAKQAQAEQAEPRMAPFLIVAPTSVVSNRAAEAARFTPGLSVVTVTDTLRRRGQQLAEVIAGADVVVTSYTLFRLDEDAYGAADWSGLVLDEAQFAKNHQSKVYQCIRRLPAPFKLAITGTPMENNLMELWSLLSITAPGLFPSPTRFRDMYARPIEKQNDAELLARLRRRIKPLVKRRTKEQVAPELPAKQEQVLEVELDPRHRRTYQRHLQRERQKVLGLIDDVERNRFTILRSITLLRRLSLHPGLVEPEQEGSSSAKVDALLEQLRDVVDGGHRALVFSQFTGFLTHVRERLDAAGVAHCYLDGTSRNRAQIVKRFKDGAAPVFLISLKAGGFGLNLTEADYCFLLDPWWNPATEAQAIDRTHRIGQTRNVMVYRLIAKDTIEEKVLALANRKAELFAGVMNDGNAFGTALDAEDIRALLA